MSQREPVLIGLNGVARSGKDTTADMIEKWCDVHGFTVARHGFADKLKESAAHALGVFEEEIVFCNKLKGDYERGVIAVHMATPGTGPNKTVASITGREFLQYYGTEAHRDVFGSDFWVDALLPGGLDGIEMWEPVENARPAWFKNFKWQNSEGTTGGNPADVCLITDCRFDNEAGRIMDLGGEIWRIERDGSGAGSAGKEGHASEQLLPGELISLIIDNNGSLSDLGESVENAMEEVMEEVAA